MRVVFRVWEVLIWQQRDWRIVYQYSKCCMSFCPLLTLLCLMVKNSNCLSAFSHHFGLDYWMLLCRESIITQTFHTPFGRSIAPNISVDARRLSRCPSVCGCRLMIFVDDVDDARHPHALSLPFFLCVNWQFGQCSALYSMYLLLFLYTQERINNN